jgi:transposase
MAHFRLAARVIQQLRDIVRRGHMARETKRAQALLWRHAGRPASDVAADLGVTPRTIQRWVRRYQQQAGQELALRIQVGKPPGRPAKQLQLARRVIEQVWQHDPRRYGFRALVWTVPMLRCLIQRRTKKWLGQATVRRALRSLRQRYKRPRLVLARRSPTWRQAKGGLNAA